MEYKVIHLLCTTTASQQDSLNAQAQGGWELVNVVPSYKHTGEVNYLFAYFKRKKIIHEVTN